MAAPKIETASARESRLRLERAAEENSPTLIGQLRAIREEWGEGFDEDIAKPLARVLQTIRKQYEAAAAEAERNADELQDKLDEIEQTGEENAVKAGAYDELLDDLSDVPRGIRTLEEIMDKHPLEASV